jgi:CRISPR/Cas system CSM-associated protein Csm4 (group 5 of RAMP superfamily)
MEALLIRLRPTGPWRYGPAGGASERLDDLYRSDRLYSAITLAMRQLGWLPEWLAATATSATPEIALSSLYPFQAETLFAVPPATIWPPAPNLVTAPSPLFLSKIRWSSARFVPLPVIDSLLSGQPILADQWIPDPGSGCLLRRDRPSSSPFRTSLRTTAAIDRGSRISRSPSRTGCAEFESGSGLWCVAQFSAEAAGEWRPRIEGAFRFLADTGLGGRRNAGWGQMQAPEFRVGSWPALVLPKLAAMSESQPPRESNGAPASHWLLSLYSPGPHDAVDWSSGRYRLAVRAGYVEHLGTAKKPNRLVTEGSVLVSANGITGAALDVAPENAPHPVYRSGFAVTVRLLDSSPVTFEKPVEEPSTPEAIEPRPCDEEAPLPPQPESEPPVAEAETTASAENLPGETSDAI